ncbi:MAG: hypothetical protein Ctma_1419 [Catillopecten margaritatus gill symbiont]|uniref:Uncharacterized protein n=1 Tax=Catillopecten margaritatus gill symbiont TaxID=3083288 RepID=A0AAU6PHZ0_9GAMM
MAIRKINGTILNQVKSENASRVPVPMPNQSCGVLQGLSTSEQSLKSAANAGKELAKLFS